MKAHELMTPNPEVVTPDDPISRAAQIMRDRDIGMVPVVENRETKALMGVITDRDIAVRHVADGHSKDCTVASHMSRENIEVVRDDDDDGKVLEAMRRREVRRLPVTDKSGTLLGVIAQADIATTNRISTGEVADVVRTISEPKRA